MADYVDVQLSTWTNTRTRTLADALTQIYAKLTAYQSDYVAQGISTHASSAGSNNISDNYTVDGRQPITGTQVVNFKACIDQQ